MRKRKPEICNSPLTGCWYLVLSWNADGSARVKHDITVAYERGRKDGAKEMYERGTIDRELQAAVQS